MNLLRKLFGLLVLLCCAGIVVAPAAARTVHAVAHVQTPVADGEHHHHAASSSVISEQSSSDTGQSDTDPADPSGHSHMPAPAFDVAAPTEALQPAFVDCRRDQLAANTPALATLSWLPLIRPPKLA